MPSSRETTARDDGTGSCSQIKSTGAPPLYAWLQFGDDFYRSRVRTYIFFPGHPLGAEPAGRRTALATPCCSRRCRWRPCRWCRARRAHALLLALLPVEVLRLLVPLPVATMPCCSRRCRWRSCCRCRCAAAWRVEERWRGPLMDGDDEDEKIFLVFLQYNP